MKNDKDEELDELLRDLDVALSVEPSPAVAARVRSRIADAPVRHWFSLKSTMAVAAAAVVVAVAYFAWPATQMPMTQSVSRQPALPPSLPAPPAVRPDSATPAIARPRPRAAAAGPDRHVLISPNQRVAMEQLSAALRAGRITRESFEPAPLPAKPDPLVIHVVTIETIKIESPISPRGGGGDLFAKRSGR